MNIGQFDDLVALWDAEGQPPDIDWLEHAQDFRNQTQALEAENAALKRETDGLRQEIIKATVFYSVDMHPRIKKALLAIADMKFDVLLTAEERK